MKIFLTGAEGFIGSHLAEKLIRKGHDLTCLILYNSFNSWGWLDTLSPEIKNEINVVPGDIRDKELVEKLVSSVESIFHLAALIGIPYSYSASQSYIDTNVLGTLNILNSCKKSDVDKILITSTSEVYGTAKYVPIDEMHPLQGQSPYSASKISADKIAESYYRSFGLPVSIVRPFNTYGPRQSARAIIPTIITQILQGQKELKVGNQNPIRDFNFVKDVVNGFLKIYQSNKTIGEEINIASGESISIGELINLIIRIVNADVKVVEDISRIRPANSEVDKLIGCNKKIKKLTDWKTKFSLYEGLEKTIEWLRTPENIKNYKSTIYNI